MRQLILDEIWIYPVKSLGGIKVDSARVLGKGLEFDRRWMLVDDTGVFISQRSEPRLALFRLSRNGRRFIITPRHQGFEGVSPAVLDPDTTPSGPALKAIIWGDEVSVVEEDPGTSEWFSHILGLRCRLVRFPETNVRNVDPFYARNKEMVSLADAYPFLIIGQSSLDTLNSRLALPVPMDRFRPNFVFKGGEPFEEDSWNEFRLGRNRFAAVKPCARCVLTTVDQETGKTGAEPLYTLSTFRRRENKVFFGQNAVAIDHEYVNTGDIVEVASRTDNSDAR